MTTALHPRSADEILSDLFATPPEAARVLRMNDRTVRRGIERGEIPAVRVGANLRVPTSWIRERAGLPAPADD